MPYSQALSTNNPGYVIILIDQSASMLEPLANGSAKADECARAVNRILRELGLACTSGINVKNRCDVSVLSYGAKGSVVSNGFSGCLTEKPIVAMKELVCNVQRIEIVKRKVPDGAGGYVEIDDEFPIWIEPLGVGSTPMGEAFYQAYNLVVEWTSQHPRSFPPVVINITDGQPNDEALAQEAAVKLSKTGTQDGYTLVLNIHISSQSGGLAQKVELPAAMEELPDQYARFLFSISSELAPAMIERAYLIGMQPAPKARGLVYNADAESMVRLLDIGTRSKLG